MVGTLNLSQVMLEPRSSRLASRTYKRANVAPSSNQLKSVLFVCWANLCRSPAGQAVFKKYLATNDLNSNDFLIDSAGVELADSHMKPSFSVRWTAYRRGYRLKRDARRVRRPELDSFDLVIAMDRKVLNALSAVHRSPAAKIKLLSEFLPRDSPLDVPDPMNREKQVCDKVLDMLELACPRIASSLLEI